MHRYLPASAFLVMGLKADVTTYHRLAVSNAAAQGWWGGWWWWRVGRGDGWVDEKYTGGKPPRDCYLLDRGVASSFSSHSL